VNPAGHAFPWNPRAALSALVDGYEALHVGEEGTAALDEARVGVMLALAGLSDIVDLTPVELAARQWRGLAPSTPGITPLPARDAATGAATRHGPARRGRQSGAALPCGAEAWSDRPLILPNRYRFPL
jgi:phytoene synthase